MQTPQATIEKLDDHGNGIRVDFHRQGDRFGHVISHVASGEATVVWRSVEDDERCPAFQEVHEQTDSDGNEMIFLHGAASGAQWSMSVCFENQKCTAVFDVAARVSSGLPDRSVAYLGEYEGAPKVKCGTYSGTTQISESDQIVRMTTSSDDDKKLPTTLRWQFAFLYI